MYPSRPSSSSFGPDVKYNRSDVKSHRPFNGCRLNARTQRPSMTMEFPEESDSAPRDLPLIKSKALIVPSPKLPTSNEPPNFPKLPGATTIAQGELSTP